MLDQFISVLVMSLISCIAGWYLGAFCQRRVDDRERAKALELHRIELEDAFNSRAGSYRDPPIERIDRIGDVIAANNHCVGLILDELKGLDAMLWESSSELENACGFRARIMDSALFAHSELDWLIRSIRSPAESIELLRNLIISIDKLEEQSVRVRNIAAEVNLLAVNAGLEASRAGEAAHGFSAFADCMRRLSGNCAETIMDSYELVDKIRHGLETIVQDVAGREPERPGQDHEELIFGFNQFENDLTMLEQLTARSVSNLATSTRTIQIIENKMHALSDSLSNGLATIIDENGYKGLTTETRLPPPAISN